MKAIQKARTSSVEMSFSRVDVFDTPHRHVRQKPSKVLGPDAAS